MDKNFNGVRLPPGARKGVPKTWLFLGKSGKWVLKTRTRVIHKFARKEDAVNWWLQLCTHREMPYRKPTEGTPPPKAVKLANMGAISIDHAKREQFIRDATKDGYEPK
ncbi:MAG: hypothetical protein ACPG46_03225 [Thalassotalea sp.]